MLIIDYNPFVEENKFEGLLSQPGSPRVQSVKSQPRDNSIEDKLRPPKYYFILH